MGNRRAVSNWGTLKKTFGTKKGGVADGGFLKMLRVARKERNYRKKGGGKTGGEKVLGKERLAGGGVVEGNLAQNH